MKKQNQADGAAKSDLKQASISELGPETENILYTEAYEELKAILETIESGEISLDELSTQVSRAAYLLEICKRKLHATELDVSKILEKFS